MPKFMTLSEAEGKRQKAITLMQSTGGDAEKFRQMDAADYAASKGAQILENPRRRRMTMPRETGPTKAELSGTLDEINDLAEEALDPELSREELVAKVKEIADLASGESDEDEDDEDSDQD